MTNSNMYSVLGRQEIEMFEGNMAAYLSAYTSSTAKKEIMEKYYLFLVSDNIIPKVEDCDLEYKKQLWESAKELSAGKLNTDGCIGFSKCLHIFSNIDKIRANEKNQNR